MTASEILLVQTSFRQIVPIADQAAALFYARLFELDPSLRRLFHGAMQEQGRKLMTILGTAVNSLDHIDQILPTLRELGIRHARSGVHEKHYATVGTAIVWSLEKNLGPLFTAEVRHAWNRVYTALSGVMIEAARIEMLAKLPIPTRLLRCITPGLVAVAPAVLGFAASNPAPLPSF